MSAVELVDAPPRAVVPVTARRSILGQAVDLLEVPAGATLAEIVAAAVPDHRHWRHVVARIEPDGAPIPRQLWQRVRPKAGHRVVIAIVPQGGAAGSAKVLRSVLMISIIAAAVALPGSLPASWGLVTSSGALTATGAALAAGTPLLAPLLVLQSAQVPR